jgi:hypothetical protein
LVYSESTIDEFGLPLKSDETRGRILDGKDALQLTGVPAAFGAPLISSLVAGFSSSMTTSTSETFGVGTRTEMPSNLPFRLGQDECDRLGGSGRGWDHREVHQHGRRRRVLVREIEDDLIVSCRSGSSSSAPS